MIIKGEFINDSNEALGYQLEIQITMQVSMST